MRHLALVLLALLVMPSAAMAETCLAAAGLLKHMIAQGTTGIWGSCTTPDATDDYLIGPVTTQLSIMPGSGGLAMEDLSIVAPGAEITIGPGRLTINGNFIHTAGTFRMQGTRLGGCRINDVTLAAGSFTVECPTLPANVAAGHYMVMGDEDPIDPEAYITQTVSIGPGIPTSGEYRPSHAKWRWYFITAVSGSTVTLSYDEYTDAAGFNRSYAQYTANHYIGSRAPFILATDAKGPTGIVVDKYGHFSTMTFATATITSNESGDGGDMYIRWIEGACAEKTAKIVYTIDGGVGADSIIVAGDASACGTSDVETTFGVRSGDLVHFVFPAELDLTGDDQASDAGEGLFVSDVGGGALQLKWARIMRPYTTPSTTHGQLGACAVCIINSDPDTANFASTSYIEDVDIGWSVLDTGGVAGDVFSFGLFGEGSGSTPVGGGRMWDQTGFIINRVYSHDTGGAQFSTTRGTHCFWPRGPRNLRATRLRLERCSDDLLGWKLARDDDTLSVSKIELHQIITQAQLTSSATMTNECVGATHQDVAGGTEAIANQGSRFGSFFATGCQGAALQIRAMGAEFNGSFTGGSQAGHGSGGQFFLKPISEPTSGAYPDGHIDLYPNMARDNIVFLAGAGAKIDVGGEIYDSVITSLAADQSSYSYSIFNTFMSLGGDINGYFNGEGGVVPSKQRGDIRDSVLIAGNAGTALHGNNVEANGMADLFIDRFYLAGNTTTGAGILGNGLNDVVNVTINGMVWSMVTPNDGFGYYDADITRTVSTTNVCIETAGDKIDSDDDIFGTTPEANTFSFTNFGIPADEPVHFRAFQGSADGVGCDVYKPRDYGLRRLSVAHTLLGDLFVEQMDSFSTRKLTPLPGRATFTGAY